jgi:putative membrane protein
VNRGRPTVVSTWIARLFAEVAAEGGLSEQRLQAVDQNLTTLVVSLGGAERIKKTPIPFAYAHHIKLSLALFVYSAPFVMGEALGWGTPIAAAVIAYALFGIDEIGVEIEDPFGYDPNDLPLEAIGETLRRDVEAVLGVGSRDGR